ncbi:hypothetical protein EHM69_03665 [candidate division KSB1 bacterium]|nr:MAG: hypothetical protein EHM69_03665 [candidate division KSB1 bacterium]
MLRRHSRISFPGTLHFITTVTSIRSDWFRREEQCRRILWEFEKSRVRHNVLCLGYVLMPDHLHAVLLQSVDGLQIAAMLRDFKAATALRCRPDEFGNSSFWRRRYNDVPLPGVNALHRRLEYMHNNPVKRGFVVEPIEWPWSSIHDFMGTSSGIVRIAVDMVPVRL